jgi:hypothetical protein
MAKTKSAAAIAEAPGKPAQDVNKAQAIAEAFRELGRDASGQDVMGYVSQKFGVKVSPNYVSIVRGNLKKKRGGRPKKAQAGRGPANGPQTGQSHAPANDTLSLIREVKAVAQKAGGMSELKRLVDALAE